MTHDPERRDHPRLRLSYPIRILPDNDEGAAPLGHTVTQNLSSRGAYFRTFRSAPYQAGHPVSIVISVPHRTATDAREVVLDLKGAGRIVRVESPSHGGPYGEDGVALAGVAVEFVAPLSFHYRWV